jgi:hypothetical protein
MSYYNKNPTTMHALLSVKTRYPEIYLTKITVFLINKILLKIAHMVITKNCRVYQVKRISNRGRIKTRLYDKQDVFNFPIVNFPFLGTNIPASPAYGIYMSQLMCYCRACAQYSDFLDRVQLLTQKLLKQDYVAPRLKSSLQKLYGRHHNLVDRYEISVSNLLLFM